MSAKFSVREEHQAVVITVGGEVSQADIDAMRARTVAIVKEMGIRHFVMDVSDLISIERRSTFAAYALGDEFRSIGFPLDAKTAVVMPTNADARKQIAFMHTVEINRGRGPLQEVDSVSDGLLWLNKQRKK